MAETRNVMRFLTAREKPSRPKDRRSVAMPEEKARPVVLRGAKPIIDRGSALSFDEDDLIEISEGE